MVRVTNWIIYNPPQLSSDLTYNRMRDGNLQLIILVFSFVYISDILDYNHGGLSDWFETPLMWIIGV
jgi:hypothetical protein